MAVGNVLQGVPFRFSSDMHIFYDGSFFGLLNPFALLCGLVSVAMMLMHGAAWLQLKTVGPWPSAHGATAAGRPLPRWCSMRWPASCCGCGSTVTA